MNEKEKAEIANLFKSIPDEFRVIENKIKEKAINEYYDILDNLDNRTQVEILKSQNNWSNIRSSKETKELLVCLSKIGNVKGYRIIEEIIKSGNPEILDFSYVSLKFARLNLENQLSDESIGFISSGLGGKENKLRYYFVIKSKEKIEKNRELIIIDELKNICTKNDSEFEESENHGNYILIKILVSIDFAIGIIIDNLTKKCPFLDKEYMCTNVEKPTLEFIEKWINDNLTE
jgi:curved DNA-binding protein CbpA